MTHAQITDRTGTNGRTLHTTTTIALGRPSEAAIQPRIFDNLRQTLGAKRVEPVNLEAVRDRLAKQVKLQDPRDLVRSPAQMSIRWSADSNRATLHVLGGMPDWINGDVASDGGVVFTRTGLKKYLAAILPSRGAAFLDALVSAHGDGGAKLATMNAALLSRPLNKPIQLRTVRTKDPGTGRIVRAVRAVFRDYTAFDDLAYLSALLDSTATRDLPVLSYRRGDDGMRVRFALAPVEGIELNTPIPMVEAWNSETGGCSVKMNGGAWKLVCLNGMSTFEKGSVYRWIHRGRASRITDGVPQAVSEIRNKADGLVDRYNQAVDVAIDNAAAWLASVLEGRAGQSTVDAAVAAMDHATATPGRMLASTVDAITWIAQQETDGFRQHELEGLAVHVMDVGLTQASRTTDRVLQAPIGKTWTETVCR